MSSWKPFLRTVQVGALAVLAAVIGAIANITSFVQLFPIALVTISAIGLIYMMDWLLSRIEDEEKQKELDRQHETNKLLIQMLDELREANGKHRDIHSAMAASEQRSVQRQLTDALNRLARSLESPNIQRLITPENESTEASSEDIPPEADSAESQS